MITFAKFSFHKESVICLDFRLFAWNIYSRLGEFQCSVEHGLGNAALGQWSDTIFGALLSYYVLNLLAISV
jgi:hypothetical protein